MSRIGPPDTAGLSVSVEDLAAAAEFIDRLQQYVDGTIRHEMDDIRKRMKGDGADARTVPDGTPFGAYEDARQQWETLTRSTENMELHLRALSRKLADLKKGTEEIAEAFRDTEERNAATGKQIERMLEAATSPPAEKPSHPPAKG